MLAQVCQPTLAAIILSSQPGGRATAARVWHMNSEVLIRTVTGLYEHDSRAEVLAAILDVLQPVRSFVATLQLSYTCLDIHQEGTQRQGRVYLHTDLASSRVRSIFSLMP